MAPNRVMLYVAVLLCATMCDGHRMPRELRESAGDKKDAGPSSPHSNHISNHHRNGVVLEAVRLRQSGRGASRGLTVMEKYAGRKNETIVDECVQNSKSPDERLCRKFTRHADGEVSTTDSAVKTKVWRALKDNAEDDGAVDETISSSGKRKGDNIGKPNRKGNNGSVGHWATNPRHEKPHPASKEKPHRTPNSQNGKSSGVKTEESPDESSQLAFEQLAYPSGDRTSNKRVSMNFTMGGY